MKTFLPYSAAVRLATLILASLALSACDAVTPTAGDLAGPQVSPAVVTGAADAVVVPTGNAPQFDRLFLPPQVRAGGALRAALLSDAGAELMAIRSARVGSQHAVSLDFGTVRGAETIIEARLDGRVVATAPATAQLNGAGGVTTSAEPTSVHYFWYQGRDGQWVMGVEYDYELQGGTPVSLVGVTGTLRADRVRFVTSGSEAISAPAAVRFEGFERLVFVE